MRETTSLCRTFAAVMLGLCVAVPPLEAFAGVAVSAGVAASNAAVAYAARRRRQRQQADAAAEALRQQQRQEAAAALYQERLVRNRAAGLRAVQPSSGPVQIQEVRHFGCDAKPDEGAVSFVLRCERRNASAAQQSFVLPIGCQPVSKETTAAWLQRCFPRVPSPR